MPLLVVYNPASGNGSAKAFVDESVIPLLRKHGKQVHNLIATEREGHPGSLVADFLQRDGTITVVLGSGDGTLHEIINSPHPTRAPLQLHFVLVPCGTANALYSSFFPPTNGEQDTVSYRLKSVQSYINCTKTKPLTLGISSLIYSGCEQPQTLISTVVISTALHASILNDSEALRKEVPGIERFKMAAQQNITRWYDGVVKLIPVSGTRVVQVYDPAANMFVPHEDSDDYGPIVHLDGPFVYFLSVVNVDRLEPAFQITPLRSKIPPTENSFDIVIVRPLRDPSIDKDTPEGRAEFASKCAILLGAAYEGGRHVNLRYNSEGGIVEGGDGPTAVEYVRCGGWEWIPVSRAVVTLARERPQGT
jgi:hypothetical protein